MKYIKFLSCNLFTCQKIAIIKKNNKSKLSGDYPNEICPNFAHSIILMYIIYRLRLMDAIVVLLTILRSKASGKNFVTF